jgi:NarL family two-component system sensor histidine kinase LiaS
MGQMPKRFRGLRWKLTLSYTVVTVATLLVVEILLLVGISYLFLNSNILPSVLVYAVENFINPQVATYLDEPEPDVESLTSWLEDAFAEGLTFRSSQSPRIVFELGELEQDTTLIVLDQNLNRLTSIPKPVESLSNDIYEGAAQLFEAARQGETDPQKTSHISDGYLTTAVPVTDDDGSVLGVVAMFMPYPPAGAFTQGLSLIAFSLILFTVATGIVGTVFGYLTARGLTGRLRAVSRAASSWSKGDFSVFIQDRSGDEIGQLALKFNRMAEQLQNLLKAKQEFATIEERNRLARDLHDSVKQQVFATVMQIGAARAMVDEDPEAVVERLNEAEHLARQAQDELAIIIRELRPVSLQEKGLLQAIKEYIDSWSRINDITAEIRSRGEYSLHLEIEQTLFRITQEALSNIAKHSEATHVKAQLVVEHGEISLEISDNGKGFDVSAAEGNGMGLRSMRERMEALGGSLHLESTLGQGTNLIARLPLTKVTPQ